MNSEDITITEISWSQSDKHHTTPFIFSPVQSLSRVQLFATPWIAARQASLSITNSRSLLKLMSIKSVMPSSHLILCHPLLLPPIPPSIRVFSNESTLHMRWPKYWSFTFSISPSNEQPGLTLGVYYNQIHKDTRKKGGCQGLRKWRKSHFCLMDISFSLGRWKNSREEWWWLSHRNVNALYASELDT